ncbi:UDP-N-acetylmuramate dehydrogenase [Acetonema longum]|uniref:UDP-N-acetylenolpyruvoylglucosamine reductase n=1 Tax=Acetonema longum DSM 6540 TaxID=1009370 RepID=F7NQ50_9FIRM|nr:UDP-N-acetylenolpyruvoylglucosamine reductase [Acetonema longum DSM 6540]
MQTINKEQKTKIYSQLRAVIPSERILPDEPMRRHTTFRIGGPADFLVLPANTQEVAAILPAARKMHLPVTLLGRGSNVLVSDKGIRGLVIRFGKNMSGIYHEGHTITAGAGATLGDVSRYAAKLGLTGMEFAVGIPGSIGGAVFMNAGAYGGEMSQIVNAVLAVSPEGDLKRFEHENIGFQYRHSAFYDNHYSICEVELILQPGIAEEVGKKMEEYTLMRNTKQPVEMPSAGSAFKRPPGHFAGTLIEQAGLKGYTVGGAQISPKHAGFIVNIGDATAHDVLELIQTVQNRVYEKFQVTLQPEVRLIGEQ